MGPSPYLGDCAKPSRSCVQGRSADGPAHQAWAGDNPQTFGTSRVARVDQHLREWTSWGIHLSGVNTRKVWNAVEKAAQSDEPWLLKCRGSHTTRAAVL